MRSIVTSTVLAIVLSIQLAASARACGVDTSCDVAHGRYFLRTPEGWDGKSQLPVAVFFHGYRGSAKETMGNEDLGRALSKAGVLLVAADGVDGSWSAAPAMSRGRDDIAYAREIVADVEKRFPVDRSLLIATGFSAGGFMVWRLACEAGDLFAAYAPVSGAFLDPIPANCPTGPVSLRHIHGTSDVTVPMAGRWIAGGRIKQSDVRQSIARMREIDSCPTKPSRVADQKNNLDCEVWSARDCGGGREIELCLHPDAHMFEGRWIAQAFDWARNLPKRTAR